jgi:hypothetical protein
MNSKSEGSTRPASSSATDQVAGKIAVEGFLAPYAKWSPRHRGKPLRVDVLIALLAGSEVAFLDTA